MNRMKVIGVDTTYDSSSMVPDSASTATAISSGYKTLSGVIGYREDKTTKTPFISEALSKKGMLSGLSPRLRLSMGLRLHFIAISTAETNMIALLSS